MRFRTGRKVGRTIYLQLGEEPSDEDLLIGMADNRVLASLMVDAVNQTYTSQELNRVLYNVPYQEWIEGNST